jgi:hypothetical protein
MILRTQRGLAAADRKAVALEVFPRIVHPHFGGGDDPCTHNSTRSSPFRAMAARAQSKFNPVFPADLAGG